MNKDGFVEVRTPGGREMHIADECPAFMALNWNHGIARGAVVELGDITDHRKCCCGAVYLFLIAQRSETRGGPLWRRVSPGKAGAWTTARMLVEGFEPLTDAARAVVAFVTPPRRRVGA